MLENVHPAWKVCVGMAMFLAVTLAYAGKVLLTQQESIDANHSAIAEITVAVEETQGMLTAIRAQQARGEERAYINRAIAGCLDIINDGEIEITEECTDPRVASYYPPSICAKLPIAIPNCGINATVVVGIVEPGE